MPSLKRLNMQRFEGVLQEKIRSPRRKFSLSFDFNFDLALMSCPKMRQRVRMAACITQQEVQ
jgi:hypothetical protein